MKIKFNKSTVYLSHPIRGSNGDIQGNCKKAAAAARRLRKTFPEVNWYCPAEHDLVLQILTADKNLSIDDVMYADLQVLTASHGWCFYEFDKSQGSEMEAKVACDLELDDFFIVGDKIIPGKNRIIYDIEKASYALLRKDFGPIVEQAIRRFRENNA